MSGIHIALLGTGRSIYAGTATVIVGFASGGSFSSYGFDVGGQGSISPTSWASTGFPVAVLKDVYDTGIPAWLDFSVTGNAPNSGWSTLTIGGTSVNRVDASYSFNGVTTSWIFIGAPVVFGTSVGASRSIIWS
jgi:hypothetical protein